MKRCLIVDAHPGVVAALEQLLTGAGFEIVGAALDGTSALELAAASRPDGAVVDHRMWQPNGAELVERLCQVAPGIAALVYTAEASCELTLDALAAGACGIVLKDAPLHDVLVALRAGLAGVRYLDPGVVGLPPASSSSQLSPRERDVLALVADGLSYAEIGRRLEIGAETARTHLKKASLRLGALTRTHAVALSLRHGLIR
jgi:DNA-binding NarL/FixJ family response regulator